MHLAKYISVAMMALGAAQAKKPKRPVYNASEPKAVNPQAQGACCTTQGGEHACGPNGSEEWFNTGLELPGGWHPPYLNISSLVTISLDDFYKGVGKVCRDSKPVFDEAGKMHNIPPVILALLSFHESKCYLGGWHPWGLIRCFNRSCLKGESKNGECLYPVTINMECAARNLRHWLDASDDNIIYALGAYDGWWAHGPGPNNNQSYVPADRCSPEGRARNERRRDKLPTNLSWLHNMLNGWFQGHNLTANPELAGRYNNLGNCTD